MTEEWRTSAELTAARTRFEDAIDGYQRPAAYGIGRWVDGVLVFDRVNVNESPLPAVVLATVCGHVSGNASYEFDAATLARAIALLAPAEACTEFEHPNLAAWRQLTLGAGESAVAVFADETAPDSTDPDIAALLAASRWG